MTRRISIHEIKLAVCVGFGVSPDSMTSPTRQRRFARTRQVAMYLARRHTRLSLPQIGERFGGRDHTTVMFAISAVETRRAADDLLDEKIARLEADLGASE